MRQRRRAVTEHGWLLGERLGLGERQPRPEQGIVFEGDSVPYRLVIDNLDLASHTVTIAWDTTQGGKHAIDYLTTYNRTVGTANPCLGVAGCGGAPDTEAIPLIHRWSGRASRRWPATSRSSAGLSMR